MKEGDQYLLIMASKAEWLEMRKNSSQETHAFRHYKGFIKSYDSKLILQKKTLKFSLCRFLCFKYSCHNQLQPSTWCLSTRSWGEMPSLLPVNTMTYPQHIILCMINMLSSLSLSQKRNVFADNLYSWRLPARSWTPRPKITIQKLY